MDDTVVIAVGIDFPEEGPLPATTGLARRALDFARLASDRGVPKRLIYLMVDGDHEVIAESKRNDSVVGSVLSAHRTDFRRLVEAARYKVDCDSVIIYWSGHGAVGRDDDRCLLFADAATTGQCVTDEELMAFLMAEGEKGARSPFTRVMLIADVCANYDSSLTDSALRSHGKFDKKFERVALYATAKGGYAYPTSGFSPAIMNWLGTLPISKWWSIRLDEVKGLYDALKADEKGQQPFAVYVHTRDGEDTLEPKPDTPRLKPADLPLEPYSAYRIDPRKTDPLWKPWEADPIPLGEQALVRLDVVFTARRAPFRAMVVEKDGEPSFVRALPSLARALKDSVGRGASITPRNWQILDDVALRGLNISTGNELRARLQPSGAGEAVPRGVLLPVRDRDYEIDWSDVWPMLDAIFPEFAVVVAFVAGSTLEGVHTAVAAAQSAANRHVAVEVYSRQVPAGPVGVVADEVRFESDPLAWILDEISARRKVLSTRGKGVLRNPVVPHVLPVRIVDEVLEALNSGALDTAKETALLRSIRESLPELWSTVVEDYARARGTPGWVQGLVVAAEIRADLTRFLGEIIVRPDRVLENPNAVTGWLTAPLVDQVGMELRHLAEKAGPTPDRKSSFERAWRLWRQRMTPAVRDAIERKASADWDVLTPRQLVMLSRHGYPAPEAAQAGNEIVRWVTVAQSPADEGLARLPGVNAGAFAAAVFDPEEPHLSDPERSIHLAGLRNAVNPSL
ncbi:hypothetical protein [Nocardia amamiensis]|uniref:hypothetical protein n=1 Tax=Nocardia amamiensis TaxID=404578 RepID=UPI0012F47853|nr:hypothetical protein [Nocardia amamiensis]